MSQDDVSHLYGGVHGITSKFERAEVEPRAMTVIRLAGCLEMTVENLLAAKEPGERIRRVKDQYGLPAVNRAEIASVWASSLRKGREAAGLTRAELGEAVGVSRVSIRLHEGEERAERTTLPGLGLWIAVAEALNVCPSRMFAGVRYVPAEGQREQRRRKWPRVEGRFVRVTERGDVK